MLKLSGYSSVLASIADTNKLSALVSLPSRTYIAPSNAAVDSEVNAFFNNYKTEMDRLAQAPSVFSRMASHTLDRVVYPTEIAHGLTMQSSSGTMIQVSKVRARGAIIYRV